MRKRKTVDGIEARLLSVPEAQTYCGQGRAATLKLAEDCNAVVRIGRRVLIDRQKLDKCLDVL